MSSESELLRNITNCRPQQNLLQTVGPSKTSEKGVDPGEIVHHRHGTIRVPLSGESEHILNNRQKKMEDLLPEAGMIEKK